MEAKEALIIEEDKSLEEALATETTFELFKQYSWLASAVIGLVILLVQLKMITVGLDMYIPLVAAGFSILIATVAKDIIVETLLTGKTILEIRTSLKIHRLLAMFSLGVSIGYTITILVI